MIYGSICSGIEAATVAWRGLGWRAAFLSEIEPFPRRLLAYHYPDVPLHGDFTTIKENEYEPIDILCGGTPCQSFSVAGKRRGLDDPRGNLTLEFVALAKRLNARWLFWENVPGVLSQNGGADFAEFISLLAECGYGVCWRVFDAKHFGIPQRRRRVFLVAYLGNWRPAAAVLFERESLRGDIAPRGEAGKEIAGTVTARTCRSRGADDAANGHFAVSEIQEPQGFDMQGFGKYGDGQAASTVKARDYKDATDLVVNAYVPDISRTLTAEGADGSFTADGRGMELIAFTKGDHGQDATANLSPTLRKGGEGGGQQVAIAYDLQQITSATNRSNPQAGDPVHTLAASNAANAAVATFKIGQGAMAGGIGYSEETAPTLTAAASGTQKAPGLLQGMGVRRLTPRECERLQGFPDDYTLIDGAADSPRYKAIGNSWAVPVVRWIGGRIETVDNLIKAGRI